MPPRLTTQEFIDRARATHGDKYGYAFSVYQGNHTKLMIHCPEHGMFEQRPNNHMNGQNCPYCSDKKHTNESFIQKATELHGDRYDYSLVKYKGIFTKVTIICREHGKFEQSPDSHLNQKSGCPKCKFKKLATDRKFSVREFIEKANIIHKYKYNYEKIAYVNSQTNVTIVCPEHGEFEQRPNHHLHGVGCPGCAEYGFDRTKSGFLYVLRSDCGQYMKIGITHNPKQRHNKLKRATPFSFKRIELIEGPGEQIANLEKELLAEYQPAEFTETFDGYTEWCLWNDSIRHKLISFMDKELTNGPV